MKKLTIAASPEARRAFAAERTVVDIRSSDLTESSVIVMTATEAARGLLSRVKSHAFGIPIVLVKDGTGQFPEELIGQVSQVIDNNPTNLAYNGRQIDAAAQRYEDSLLPPFFGALERYVEQGKSQFDCPGHQGGAFFRRHPVGREFYNFFGETLFRSDLCNADVAMGDLLIHEGYPFEAQRNAAKVFNADNTYFVLGGTSAANQVVLTALLAPGDLVLYDSNNHKSVQHGALIQAGATAVYLETARNAYGFIGGIDNHCFDEEYIRSVAAESDPVKARQPRPFRLAVIQLGTYDGTIGNARQIVDRIGHLCDYILFGSAWVGYEQFIPMMKDCSPLLLELGPDDPGIFVTQSVHKQQAGFSQCSQIHKKDSHIRDQRRYVSHKRLNSAFMMHGSTSPFYPLFAALDVNAQMHRGESGRLLWADCVRVGIEARKYLLRTCRYIKPFIPPEVDGKPWESYPTEVIANDLRFFRFEPGAKWHGFEDYGKDQYFVDPCKFLLTTPGINIGENRYEEFGVPAGILAEYLRENGIVPEKADLNSILFLMTPAEDLAKMENLVNRIAHFEQLLDRDAPLAEVLPALYQRHQDRYRDYSIRDLCRELHDYYREYDLKKIQKAMFRKDELPHRAMLPQAANYELVRGNCDFIPLSEARGRIALEGALPYPPGVITCVPGEVWEGVVLDYFLALEEGVNRLPGFTPELQGVYIQKDPDGRYRIYGYVLTKERAKELGLRMGWGRGVPD
ncbi:MAG: ornithine decarboxylase [Sutterellaceae bacterium]|nr:ornithine decarboxylase [Sutterellaceae bacterium]